MKTKVPEIAILLIISVLLIDCSALNRTMDKHRERREKEVEEGYEAMKELAFSGLYQFEATRAYGAAFASVDLRGGIYYLIVNYYEVYAYLPFYGVQHMADSQRESSISIEGELEDIMIEESDSRHRVLVRFSVKGDSDTYIINLDIGPNADANLTVSSTRRSTITYLGKVTPFEPEEEEEKKLHP